MGDRYRVFKDVPEGPKPTLRIADSEEEAQAVCSLWDSKDGQTVKAGYEPLVNEITFH